jgi:SAM-dependent methyltransferase
VTAAVRRGPPRRIPGGAPRRQAEYWDERYRSDPTFFGAGASPFLEWVLAALEGRTVGRTWVELGSGYGRDLGSLRRHGHAARGVDVSRVGTALARRAGLEAVRGHALRFLSGLRARSVGVVFSNLFLNMEFTEEDHERLLEEVHRVLVPGGFHAYSVRSVSDRWYGKGVPVGPHTFDYRPDGPVMHFFSREYARRLRRGRFRNVRSWEGTEDPKGFPIEVLYVLDQKRSPGPR